MERYIRMQSSRLKTLLALLFAFALTAGACSGDEAADTDAGSDTTAAGEEESTDTTAALRAIGRELADTPA